MSLALLETPKTGFVTTRPIFMASEPEVVLWSRLNFRFNSLYHGLTYIAVVNTLRLIFLIYKFIFWSLRTCPAVSQDISSFGNSVCLDQLASSEAT